MTVLLSQLLMVPLPQPLLGHVGRERREKPSQSAGAVEGGGPPLLGRSPVHQLRCRQHACSVTVSVFDIHPIAPSFTGNPPPLEIIRWV